MSSRPLTAAGRAHLKKRMLALPEKMRTAADAALAKAADELVADIQAATPVASGDLRDSIKKVPLGDGRIGYRVVGGEHGKGKKGWYIRFVEHGTKAGVKGARTTDESGRNRKVQRTHSGTRAQPFFWPTYRRSKTRIRSRLTRALKKAAKES